MSKKRTAGVLLTLLLMLFSNISPALASGYYDGYMVSPGLFHTLYVKNGELFAWGDNSFGELGDGTQITRLMPVKIPFDKGNILSISAGMGFSLVLTSDGKLWKFGLTLSDNTPSQTTPVEVLASVKGISAGTDFALALKQDGTVWVWGNNTSGQLGNGNTEKQLSFTQVSNLFGITQVSAGADHSMALDQNGNVWTWGDNTYGQLGLGDNENRNKPVKLTQAVNIKQISAGYEYSLALNSAGKAYAWGRNDVGQLGVPSTIYSHEKTPKPVTQTLNFDQVEAGSSNSFAYGKNNNQNYYFIWGDNKSNLIVSKDSANYREIIDYPCVWNVPGTNTIDIAAGYGTVFLNQTTGIKAVGYNYSGQLGDGTMIHSYAFADVLLDQNTAAAHRLGGKNRLETAAIISYSGWPYGEADSVILARADSFPDALSGTPLAYAYAAPILLTDKKTLSAEAAWEIERIQPETIYLLGGEGAISKDIANKLQHDGYKVVRLGGNDRFETSYKIARYLFDNNMIPGNKAVVCNGLNYPDALSVSSAAAYQKMPILLTRPDDLSPAAQTALNELGVQKAYVIGGTGVVSEAVEQKLPDAVRYGGTNRYDTSLEVARNMGMDTGTVFFASGTNFPDALAGSALASFTNSPIVLVGSNPPDLEKYTMMLNRTTRNVYILGGESVISDDLLTQMENRFFPLITAYYQI